MIFSIATALGILPAVLFLLPQQISPAKIDLQWLLFRGILAAKPSFPDGWYFYAPYGLSLAFPPLHAA